MLFSKVKKGLLKVRKRQLFESLNFLTYRKLYKNFLRHPEVTDARTNVNIGAGFGMARTTDPLKLGLIFLRHAGLPFWFPNSWILDLGCGDGIVLKLLEKLRYRKIAGIENDNFLCTLAKQNCPKSQIIGGDFLQSRSISEVVALNPRVIYAFNPAPPEEILFFFGINSYRKEFDSYFTKPKSF